jgi:hypothetical protein
MKKTVYSLNMKDMERELEHAINKFMAEALAYYEDCESAKQQLLDIANEQAEYYIREHMDAIKHQEATR